MRKIIVTLLCLMALMGAVCTTVSATTEDMPMTREAALEQSARKSYYRSLYRSGKDSLHGYCGLMTSGQLYALDINTTFVSNNGNDQFDYYAGLEVTSGGYYITPYYLEDYSMEEALNHLCRQGTRDVYNILVCFQWTNTAAGSKYGHAVLINGIIDGTVYFVESFDLSLDQLYPEGSVITCSIPEFVAYYEKWATYEGLIWFGNGDYADICEEFGADLVVNTRKDTVLRSQPCNVEENNCLAIYDIAAGEQLRCSGIFVNPQGERFYRIDDGEFFGYILQTDALVTELSPEDLWVTDLKIPQRIVRGGAAKFQGEVVSANTALKAVEITVSDMQGRQILSVRQECGGVRQELSKLSLGLDTQHLPEGAYLVQIFGESDHYVPDVQGLRLETGRVRLAAQMMLVGNVRHDTEIQPVLNKVMVKKKADA